MKKGYFMCGVFTTLRVLITMLLVLGVSVVYGVPARPGVITVKQADGSTINIKISGDEHFNWTTTTGGYPIVEKDGYYYYAQYDVKGVTNISTQRVSINGRELAPSSDIVRQDISVIAASQRNNSPMKQMQHAPMQQAATFPNEGVVRSAIILVEFQDVKFTADNPQQAFNNQLNQEGYSVNGAVGSAKDYYAANSKGKFQGQFDVYGPYQLEQKLSYYGARTDVGAADIRPQDMVSEAVKLADPDIDFSQYDLDDDGVIDNIFIYYAGYNEAEGGGSDCIWPHKWNVFDTPVHDGKTLWGYACTSELRLTSGEGQDLAGIGTFCHEFGHVFGLADHYDTDGSTNGYSWGLHYYDIMTLGCYNNNGDTPPLMNALEMEMIGWCEPEVIDKAQSLTIEPIQNHTTYKIETDVEGEYFLLENRKIGSTPWDAYIPADGLLVTHVDRSANWMGAWEINGPNNDISHECFHFVVATDAALGEDPASWEGVPFPNGESNAWNIYTKPRAQSWSGNPLDYQLENIARSGDNITVDVQSMLYKSIVATVRNTFGTNTIAGAEVTIRPNTAQSAGRLMASSNEIYTTTTDENGYFEFEGIPSGEYMLQITHPDYVDLVQTITIEPGLMLSLTMFTDEQAKMESVSYTNGEYSVSLGAAGQFRPYAYMTKEMFRAHIGRKVNEVRFYATNPFEGTLIIQPDNGIGWGHDFSVGEGELGWRSVDLESYDIMIEEGKDYAVKIQVITEDTSRGILGMDSDTSLQYDGYSNMIDDFAAHPGDTNYSAYAFTGGVVKGNLMIEMALSDQTDAVAPTSIELLTASSLSINRNMGAQVEWSVLPEGANRHCDWVSSNPSVATVDGFGNIMALNEGNTTISATSLLNSSLTITLEVTVSSEAEARAKGRLVEFSSTLNADKVVVPNVEVEFTAIPLDMQSSSSVPGFLDEAWAAAPSRNLEYSSIATTRAPQEYQSVTSDADGCFEVNDLIAGRAYTMSVVQDVHEGKYRSASRVTEVMQPYTDENSINIIDDMDLFDNGMYDTERVRYSTTDICTAGVGEAALQVYAIKLPKESLVDKIGYEIVYTDAHIYELYCSGVWMRVAKVGRNGQLVIVHDSINDDVSTPGYYTFEHVTPAIIEPECDYYICVKMIGKLGIDTSSTANDGEANLIYDGVRFSTISDFGYTGTDGAWMISAFFKERAVDPLQSIEIAPSTEEFVPYVGLSYQLEAIYNPTTAVYKDIIWSSSNPESVSITEDGVIEILDTQKVTITAQSVTYPDIKGEYSFTPMLYQALGGYTLDSDGNRLTQLDLDFYPAQRVVSTRGGISVEQTTRADGVKPISTRSNSNGEFTIELPEGTYDIEAKKDGYVDYYGTVDIVRGWNSMSVIVYNYIEYTSDLKSWARPIPDYNVGMSGSSFAALQRWNSEDLVDNVGDKITRIKALIMGPTYLKFNVFHPDTQTFLYESQTIIIEDSYVQMVSIDIPKDEAVTIEEGKDYFIGYQVFAYDEESLPAFVSTADETQPGKGDVVFIDNEESSLTEEWGEESGNWIIAFYLQDDNELKGVNVDAFQTDAHISWNPNIYTSFKLSYGKKDSSGNVANYTEVELSDCQFQLDNLEAGASYHVKVSGSENDAKYEEIFDESFTTVARRTTMPLIYLPEYEYEEGNNLTLRAINLEEGDIIRWYVNDTEMLRDQIMLTKGYFEIRCEVMRDSRVYRMNRSIEVK
ncbi:MAG: M6 family metalloprotease domain-containing protein [Rikenellaceae bacterium]